MVADTAANCVAAAFCKVYLVTVGLDCGTAENMLISILKLWICFVFFRTLKSMSIYWVFFFIQHKCSFSTFVRHWTQFNHSCVDIYFCVTFSLPMQSIVLGVLMICQDSSLFWACFFWYKRSKSQATQIYTLEYLQYFKCYMELWTPT